MVAKKFISFIYPKFLKKSFGFSVSNSKLRAEVKKACFIFIYNRFIRIPLVFSGKRIACYDGKFFFSFLVKRQFVGSFVANFIKTKKMGYFIHVKKGRKIMKRLIFLFDFLCIFII